MSKIYRFGSYTIDLSRVAAIEWWWADQPEERRTRHPDDEHPTLYIWFVGGYEHSRASLELRDTSPGQYEAFVAAWEAMTR